MRISLSLLLLAICATPLRAQVDPDRCAPVTGFADVHAHQFSHLGFGERLFLGAAWHPDGIAAGLAPCGQDGPCIGDGAPLDACLGACDAVDGTCQGACDLAGGACTLGCQGARSACLLACDDRVCDLVNGGCGLACEAAAGTCDLACADGPCDLANGACNVACVAARGTCEGGCTVARGECEVECRFNPNLPCNSCADRERRCDAGCAGVYADCFSFCSVDCDGCRDGCSRTRTGCLDGCNVDCAACRGACSGTFSDCQGDCRLECDACRVACVDGCEASVCAAPHGPGGQYDQIGRALGEGALGHDVRGWPTFAGWPTWHGFTHQQMWIDWLQRAHAGGLRLMVNLAVSNRMLCEFVGPADGASCDDTVILRRQIQAAWDLQAHVDRANDGELDDDGWYRIVTSPAEARAVIRQGRLAVVLGSEMDVPFGCSVDGPCTPESVRAAIREFKALGLRYFFPVHVWDNAFGGAAVSNDFVNLGQTLITGQPYAVRDCGDEGYTFTLGSPPPLVAALLNTLAGFFGADLDARAYPDAAGHCNARGLTPLGEALLDTLMDEGFIVDVDHMSRRTLDAALDRLEARRYPAVVASHAHLNSLMAGAEAPAISEFGLWRRDVERIGALGGLIGLPTTHALAGTDKIPTHQPEDGRAPLPHDCGHSSSTFAQTYLWALDVIGAGGVAFGTDFNGFGGQIAPRFGPDACGGDGADRPQAARVGYPFALPAILGGGAFDRHVAGERTFDINTDGLAHVGLLPDLIMDLRAVGLAEEELDPLLSSAENFLRMWERLEDTPATLDVPAALTVEEGRPARITARVIDPDCQDGAWEASGDPGDGTAAVVALQDRTLTLEHTWIDDGEHAAVLTITDAAGAEARAEVQITVENVAPQAVRLATAIGPVGSPTGLRVSFSDPGIRDTHQVFVDWGDGQTTGPQPVNGTAADLEHPYLAAGPVVIRACVRDDDEGEGCAEAAIEIAAAPPMRDAGPPDARVDDAGPPTDRGRPDPQPDGGVGPADATPAPADGAPGGSDAAPEDTPTDEGCACRSAAPGDATPGWLALTALIGWRRRLSVGRRAGRRAR